MTAPLAFPKPIRKERKAKRWQKKPARRLSRPGSDPGRLEFCRSLDCVGALFIPGHICNGAVEASHDRNGTGLARKEPDRRTVPMCTQLHRQWEQHKEPFTGWSHLDRVAWMDDRINEVQRAWEGMPESQREWWQGEAERKRRLRAEAFRGWA